METKKPKGLNRYVLAPIRGAKVFHIRRISIGNFARSSRGKLPLRASINHCADSIDTVYLARCNREYYDNCFFTIHRRMYMLR